jgi:hypothetical protein
MQTRNSVSRKHRTSEFVAGKLAEFGCDVHRNIGKTSVVGVHRTGNCPSIGLRADMNALPIRGPVSGIISSPLLDAGMGQIYLQAVSVCVRTPILLRLTP